MAVTCSGRRPRLIYALPSTCTLYSPMRWTSSPTRRPAISIACHLSGSWPWRRAKFSEDAARREMVRAGLGFTIPRLRPRYPLSHLTCIFLHVRATPCSAAPLCVLSIEDDRLPIKLFWLLEQYPVVWPSATDNLVAVLDKKSPAVQCTLRETAPSTPVFEAMSSAARRHRQPGLV